MSDVLKKLTGFGVIPVVVINRESDARPLAQALVNGGIKCAEVTFRTDAAEGAIKVMTESFPDMLVGAGTVIDVDQVNRAVNAGAKFIVSPGFDGEVVDHCIKKGIPVIPGVATPTEVLMGIKKGLRLLKFFPAQQAGGTAMIKALSAPFPGLSFVPTGGINEKNLAEYLENDRVSACGGSWMVKSSLIDAGDFKKIEELTAQAAETVRKVRG